MEEGSQAPLLDPNEGEKEASHLSSRIIRPRRKIVVEPVLVLNALVGFPLILTMALYVYNRFQMIAAKNLALNMSALDFSHLEAHCDVNKSSDVYKLTYEAQTMSSFFNIMTGIAGSVPCIFSSLLLGPYSDKAGRKYTLIIPLIGTMIYGGICLVVIICKLSVWYLLIGSFIDGLGGKYIVVLMGSFAYIADITDPEDRQFRITVVEMIAFMSSILGPIGFGYWIKSVGYMWPIVLVEGIILINLAYAIFFVPETVVKDPTAKFFTFTHVKTTVQIFFQNTKDNRIWKLRNLYIALVPVVLVALGDQITTLFLQNIPLCWGSAKIGVYNGAYIAACTIGGIVSAKLFKCCMQDQSIALISGFSSVIKNAYNAIVQNSIMMYLVPVLSVTTMLFIPTIRAMMSNLVGPTEQGSVFSAVALLEVICSLVGNLIFTSIYAKTMSITSGFVYFIEAGFYLLGTGIILIYCIRRKMEKRQDENIVENLQDSLNTEATGQSCK